MSINLSELLSDEQLRELAEARGFNLVPKMQPAPPAAPSKAPSTRPRPDRAAGPSKQKVVERRWCKVEGCDTELVKKPGPGRWPSFCADHKSKGLQPCAECGFKGNHDNDCSKRPAPKASKAKVVTPATFVKTTVLQEIIPEERRRCGRCDSPEHSVFDCPVPMRSKRQRKAEKAAARKPSAVTLVPDQQRGFAVTNIDVRSADERRKDREALEEPMVRVDGDGSALSDNEIASTGSQLAQLWTKTGLPRSVGFSYLPDVLALYGLDQDMVESCLRSPDRVEVRPESFHATKRYVVLGFHKADVNVILGMRDQHHPCVIAVYVTAMLENDIHRVGYTGGGGTKKQSGPPKTHTQVASRLRDLGCTVIPDRDHKTAKVTYQGQELGAISYTPTTSRQQADSDWNRMQRKVHGINQKASA